MTPTPSRESRGEPVPALIERVLRWCPECGRVASVPEWCKRPICVHAWDGCAPEIWDGDDTDGEGHPVEQSPTEAWRTPGPRTWTAMVPEGPFVPAEQLRRAVDDVLRLRAAMERAASDLDDGEESESVARFLRNRLEGR